MKWTVVRGTLMPMSTLEESSTICSAANGSTSLCVLASGSAGNCSVVVFEHEGMRRACLIDLGVSPRRTMKLLAERGIGMHQIDDVLLTHLDSDHCYGSWGKILPRHVRVRVHGCHAHQAGHILGTDNLVPFDSGCTLESGTVVNTVRLSHDQAGVVAMRFNMHHRHGGGSLGFATDLGSVTPSLIQLFRARDGCDDGVDVLAIESNYCPRLQASSGRPYFLIQRITGGAGHLSNQEAFEAIRAIEPRHHVVLLHLSDECNNIDLVAAMHEGADYHVTITSQEQPTRWIRVAGRAARPVQQSLFAL
ncbi:MAG: MBL fold metallo-hydrolase [Pyrinomonadaceae bacterium]|nr:MBL fold metallo-hydrolase [Phycisphaerales bacterium]